MKARMPSAPRAPPLALLFVGQIRVGDDPFVLHELSLRLALNTTVSDVFAHLSPTYAFHPWHGSPSYNDTAVPGFERAFRRTFRPVSLAIATDSQVIGECSRAGACSHPRQGPLPGDISRSNHSVLFFRLLLLHDMLVARERALAHSFTQVIRLRLDAFPTCHLHDLLPSASEEPVAHMLVARDVADGVAVMTRRAATAALQAYESARRGWACGRGPRTSPTASGRCAALSRLRVCSATQAVQDQDGAVRALDHLRAQHDGARHATAP